jgi:hypothetical protein
VQLAAHVPLTDEALLELGGRLPEVLQLLGTALELRGGGGEKEGRRGEGGEKEGEGGRG